MFDRAQILRITPDAKGKGGIKSTYHSRPAGTMIDTWYTRLAHVWFGRWRQDSNVRAASIVVYSDTSAINGTKSLHSFVSYPSATNPSAAPVVEILSHSSMANFDRIWDNTTGAILGSSTEPMIPFSKNATPAVFQTIQNRCFIATGVSEGIIYDGTNAYPLGITQPVNAPGYNVTHPHATLSGVYAYGGPGVKFLNSNLPGSPLMTLKKGMSITISGISYTTQSDPVASGFPALGSFTIVSHGAGASVLNINQAWQENGYYFGLAIRDAGTLEPLAQITSYSVAGSVTTVNIDQNWSVAASGAYVITGSQIQVSPVGVAESGSGLGMSVTYPSGTQSWTGRGPQYAYAWYDPLTGHMSNISPITQVTEQDQVGVSVELTAFSYPGVDPAGSFASWAATTKRSPTPPFGRTDYERFPIIIIFRTVLTGNGSVLFPIGALGDTLTNYYYQNPALPVFDVWNDTFDDSYLIESGVSIAPRFTNSKPLEQTGGIRTINTISASATVTGTGFEARWAGTKVTLYNPVTGVIYDDGGALYIVTVTNENSIILSHPVPFSSTGITMTVQGIDGCFPCHMAYWDGRLWINATDDPGGIVFSADDAQAPLGVAVECFPPTNRLMVPAADGRVTGMRVIGANLVITTERWAYYISGNNESNYRAVRYATSMCGVGDYQMAEVLGEAEQEGAAVAYLAKDKRVYIYAPGSGAVCLSNDIQSTLNSQITSRDDYYNCRIHMFMLNGRRGIVVRTPSSMFIYDMDLKVWTDNTFTPVPQSFHGFYGSVFKSTEELVASGGAVGAWLDDTVTSAMAGGAYVKTFPLDFTGKKSRKQINYIKLYTGLNASSATWSVTVTVNETTTVVMQVTPNGMVTNQPQYSELLGNGTAIPLDSQYAAEVLALPTGGTMTTGPVVGPLVGYRFVVTVQFPTDGALYELYAIDVCYSEVSDAGEVSL